MTNKNKKTTILTIILTLFVLFSVQTSFATLELKHLHFDPAIIVSGDEVDVVIEYQATNLPFSNEGDIKDYTFQVQLFADDDVSKEYTTILDSVGDNLKGSVIGGETYYKNFRIKVHSNAPALNYQYKIVGNWYKNGQKLKISEEMRFEMPVKKEGIILDFSTLTTTPAQVRAGDKYVQLNTILENVGQKPSKSVEVNLITPQGIKASYSNNNRVKLAGLNNQESKDVIFTIDLDKYLKEGVYNLTFNLKYMDLDDNQFEKNITLPFLVKKKPILEITKVEGQTLAGDSSKLKVWVKNTGEEDAESVDVRLLKQNSQPFELDSRSSYIGELQVGEEGLAVFEIDTNSKAQLQNYSLKLLIRAKGDSDEGDNTIYSFNRRANYEVYGVKPNNYITYGAIALGLILLFIVFSKFTGNKKKEEKKNKK